MKNNENTLIKMIAVLNQIKLECETLCAKIEEGLEDDISLDYDDLSMTPEFTDALDNYDLLLEEID